MTDEELVELMRQAYNDPDLYSATDDVAWLAVLARIRRPLVARGIEVAADEVTDSVVHRQLLELARQHAAGEDAPVRLCGDGRAERG